MATDWKSPSAPVADLARTPHRLPSSTQAVAYRSLDDCTRMGRRSRAISVPFMGIATNPPTARTRRSSESNLESRQISTDAVNTDGSGGRDLKATDGVRDGARLGAKRQRVLSESDGDDESRTNPPPPSRQDVDAALSLKSEENGDDPSGNGLMPEKTRQQRKFDRTDNRSYIHVNNSGHTQARDDDGQAQPPQCHYEGCTKHARLSGGVFCRRHGEGRRCKTPGCNKVDVGGGSCRRHGGGRRCGSEGCLKTDVGGGFCVSHGGGKRCQVEGCTKGAQAGGLFCKSHGGGRRCRIKGCMTSAQSGADVLCIKHGGGKRCLVPGCTKLVRKNNRCTKHASQASELVVPSSGASTTAATVMTAVDNSTETAGGSIEGRRLASSPSLPDSNNVMEMTEVQPNRTVSVKPPSERGDVELDRAPPPPLAASITNRPSYSSPPLPSMTSITMAGKRSALHPEAEGRPDLRQPVARLSGRGDPLPTSPQVSLPNSSSAVVDPAVSAGDATLKATGPVLQEAGRAFQQPLPRFASMEPSFDPGRVVFSSGRIRNSVGSLATDSTLPPHVAADGPLFPPGDNARVEFSHKMIGSNVDLHRYSGSNRCPDGGIERSQLSTSLLPPPHPHSRHLLPPPSSVDRVAPTVPTFAADFGSGGIGDGWSRYAYNGSVVSYVEARGGRLEVGPLNASMWSNGESSTPADPSAPSAQRPFTSTPSPTYSLPAIATTWQRPSTPPSASSALDDSSGPEDKALIGISPDDRSVEPHGSEDSSPLAPTQARCSEETTPSGEIEGRDTAQGCSCSVPKMSRTRSPQTPSQSQTYISLSVKGMMCMESCGQMVQRVLGEVEGVRSVTVHFPTRTASVQVEPDANVSVTDLTSALEAVGFESSCIATSTSEEPALEEAGVNAVWAIASALGLVDGGCAMAWGDQCNCGEDCECVNCPVHIKKVSHAVDLVLKAVDLSHSTNPASPAQRDVSSSD